MVLFFSATGNSAYAAKKIANELQDETLDLFKKIRDQDFSELYSETPWVVVLPTYAWRIPHILQKWLDHTKLTGNKKLYFVMTCGGSIGNAGAYVEKWSRSKGFSYCGCLPIIMPENYIALFETPSPKEALEIINRAEKTILTISQLIQNGEPFPPLTISLKDRLSSGIVNDMFYPAFVHAKKFYATEKCISCGKCVRVCPLKNIELVQGKPIWGNDCTHCMACICRCPREAIEYGNHTKGMARYTCPKNV